MPQVAPTDPSKTNAQEGDEHASVSGKGTSPESLPKQASNLTPEGPNEIVQCNQNGRKDEDSPSSASQPAGVKGGTSQDQPKSACVASKGGISTAEIVPAEGPSIDRVSANTDSAYDPPSNNRGKAGPKRRFPQGEALPLPTAFTPYIPGALLF